MLPRYFWTGAVTDACDNVEMFDTDESVFLVRIILIYTHSQASGKEKKGSRAIPHAAFGHFDTYEWVELGWAH